MDIKWKDGEDNILNAKSDKIIYFNAKDNIKTIIQQEDIKKITIEDRLMNIFKDFEDDLTLSIVIPKKNKRDAVKIFNKYDKTGVMLKGKSNDFLLNLILESSIILGNPFLGIIVFANIGIFSILFLVLGLEFIFGTLGVNIARILIIGYPVYLLISYILVRIKRKTIKENNNKHFKHS